MDQKRPLLCLSDDYRNNLMKAIDSRSTELMRKQRPLVDSPYSANVAKHRAMQYEREVLAVLKSLVREMPLCEEGYDFG